MRPITQHLPCSTMDYIYTQTAHQGSRDVKGCTGSGGHLTKHNPMQACGKGATTIHHARGHPSPRLLDLRQPLWDLSQTLVLEGQAGDRVSYKYTLFLSKAVHYIYIYTGQKYQEELSLHTINWDDFGSHCLSYYSTGMDRWYRGGLTVKCQSVTWNFSIKSI